MGKAQFPHFPWLFDPRHLLVPRLFDPPLGLVDRLFDRSFDPHLGIFGMQYF